MSEGGGEGEREPFPGTMQIILIGRAYNYE